MRVCVRFLLFAVLTVSLAVAGVEVAFDESVDLTRYKTYAWEEGTPAARPEVQQWIVDAIDRELRAKGLRPAMKPPADVYVVSVAFAELDYATRSNYLHSNTWDVGVITTHVVGSASGTLIIDLLDGVSQKGVWRAVATEAMSDTIKPEKLEKKIDKIAKKMFKDFPKR